MKILVSGGCGFIGSNFVHLLLENNPNVTVINFDKLTYAGNLNNLERISSSPQYAFVKGDICDRNLLLSTLERYKINTIVHFAAESHVDRSITGPADFIQSNIVGTFTLLEAAREVWRGNFLDKRFIHVSTDEVYGSLGDSGFFTEETPYDPRSPYSASKASSDHLASAYFHTYGLPVITTNCSNNYGPYQFPEKLIPLIIHNALNGKDLPVYGDGKNVRDWLYVNDHCSGILEVLEKGTAGEKYNIGGNNEKQNIQVVHVICDLLDEKVGFLPNGKPRRSLIRYVKDRPGHDRRYAIDASKIKNELGWKPSVSFETGIRQTIDWYLSNSEWVASVIDGSYMDYYDKQYGLGSEGNG